jgi:hypothetical protein
VAGKAIILNDVQVPLDNVTHHGEVWTTAFRWPSEWRRFLVDVASPSPHPLAGLSDVQASWERQTYLVPAGGASEAGATTDITEDHASASMAIADWMAGVLRWQVGATVDRWNDRQHVGISGIGDVRLAGDRVSIGFEGRTWFADATESGFGRGDTWIAWRSTPRPNRPVWKTLVEASTTSVNSPMDLWSGAGMGQARPALLRAHTLFDDNVIVGEAFGRTLTHATGEYQRPIREVFGTAIGLAVFVDTARAWHRVDGTSSPWLVDAGLGVRWTAPGIGSTIRLDVAQGLRGGGLAASLGWQAFWPRQ